MVPRKCPLWVGRGRGKAFTLFHGGLANSEMNDGQGLPECGMQTLVGQLLLWTGEGMRCTNVEKTRLVGHYRLIWAAERKM